LLIYKIIFSYYIINAQKETYPSMEELEKEPEQPKKVDPPKPHSPEETTADLDATSAKEFKDSLSPKKLADMRAEMESDRAKQARAKERAELTDQLTRIKKGVTEEEEKHMSAGGRKKRKSKKEQQKEEQKEDKYKYLLLLV
jgi:hypothetical protein